ncbi:MAG TPA: amidohydrolase family protein [Candidatus Sulfotelmatobacter sp.]|nr:amidohydrolase family protein [Candidatus Sulfotelmatobacter sp.]
MQRSTRWFGWIALIAPLHMSEQLLFGIDELARLRRVLAVYYSWFQQPDYGTVVLVAVVGTLLLGLTYGILAGGLLKEISLSIWALLAVGEVHHIVETIAAGRYTPGTATAIPYVTFGILLRFSIVREHRQRGQATSSARRLQQIVAASVVALLGAPSFGQISAPRDEFIIRNARIFDGSRVIPKGDVWVENGMIKAVGPHIAAPARVPSIDATGKTLLPGLIDSHVHTMGQDTNLRSALALGVTTEFDMGAAEKYAFKIKSEQAAGKALDLADLRASEIHPTAPDGHGTEYGVPVRTISSPEEAQGLVDAGITEGDDFIGEIIYDDGSEFGLRIPTLNKTTLQAVIEASHRRGKLAVVHVLSLQAAKDAIAAGADGLAHLFADRPADAEFLRLAAQHRVFVIPTLSVLASAAGASNGPSLAADQRLNPYLTSEAITDLRGRFPRNAGSLSYAEEAVRQLKDEGIPILAGTDAHNLGTAHGASLLGELELLVNAGLTPTQALASATSVNAAAFQLNDRGQIAPGKRADLLLVDGDPTTRISDIRNIDSVWKLGVKFDREGYRATLNAEKQAEETQRHSAAPAGSESGLISDFEKGTAAASFGFGWMASAGSLLGGHKPEAHIRVIDGGANHSLKALQITGEITPGVFGWAGAMFFPGSHPMAPVNLSGKSAISFWTKGDGRTYQLMLLSKSKGPMPLTKAFAAGSEWEQVTISLAELGSDGSDLEGIIFAELAEPGRFSFGIDDVRLEPTSSASSTDAQPSVNSEHPSGGPSLDNYVAIRPTNAATMPAGTSTSAWRIDSTTYLWLQGVHGTVGVLGHEIGFKASPEDLMTRAKPGIQQLLIAQHGRLSITGDILWTPIEVKSSNSLLNPAPAMLSKADYRPVTFTPEAGYRVLDNRRIQIDGLTGLRYWHMGADFTLAPIAGGGSLSKPMNWVDPLVGARLKFPISRKLTAAIQGDAGGWGVGSQLDYQMLGALSYRIKPRWALHAGWRYMYTDYSNGQLHSRVAQSGVVIGMTHNFKRSRSE